MGEIDFLATGVVILIFELKIIVSYYLAPGETGEFNVPIMSSVGAT